MGLLGEGGRGEKREGNGGIGGRGKEEVGGEDRGRRET